MRQGTGPAPDRQIAGGATDLLRNKQELMTENAFLRQQMVVLTREHTRRLPITQQDRRVLVLLARTLRGWKDTLHTAKPNTMVKWHRQGCYMLI
jgi:hypothetical protein